MSSKAWANKTIPEPTKGPRLLHKNYTLRQIAKACHDAFLSDRDMLCEFAKAFAPDREGLHDLFDFVDRHFRYVEDRAFDQSGDEVSVQAVQSPSYMWHVTQTGDCKSFTVFIACAVYNMGLPVVLRLVNYGSKYEYHIYPVALLNGEEIPMDVVFKKQQGGRFAQEKFPMRKIEDIIERPGLYKVGNTNAGSPTAMDFADFAADVRNAFEDYDFGSGPDITEMSKGEFAAWQANRMADAFGYKPTDADKAGIAAYVQANTAPAFPPVAVRIPKPAKVGGLIDRLKDVVTNVVDAVQEALKKLANTFHKEDARKVSPYFMYLYLTKDQVRKASDEVRRRMVAQNKIVDSWEKDGKMGTRAQILASMATEFKKQYGVTPQQALAAAMSKPKRKIGDMSAPIDDGAGATGQAGSQGGTAEAQLALKALDKVVAEKDNIANAVKKIFSLLQAIFGKKAKADEEATVDNWSDPDLLSGDGDGTGGNGDGNGGGGDTTEAGGMGMLLPLLAIGVGVYLVSKK